MNPELKGGGVEVVSTVGSSVWLCLLLEMSSTSQRGESVDGNNRLIWS